MPVLDPQLEDWARGLLKASTLIGARYLDRIYLVDEHGICFTTRLPGGLKAVAKTALLKHGAGGGSIYKVVAGWGVLAEPGLVHQGPVAVG